MIRSIRHCHKNKTIASFYCNPDDCTAHYTGFVEKFNENEILIAHISPNGYYDGYILRHIDDVYRIDYDSDYENKIAKLYCFRNQQHKLIDTFEDDDMIICPLLDYAKKYNLVVTLEFEDNSISGFINGYSGDVVCINCLNESGIENGISTVNLDDIEAICVDTEDEQNILILNNNTRNTNT